MHLEGSTTNRNKATVPATQAVLLPTAIAYVKDINGTFQKCRVLVDSAWQGSLPVPVFISPNKSGDKLRLVFNRSAKSSNGVSVNGKLRVSPQLQTDLTTLLIRFRIHKIAITADIEKFTGKQQSIGKDSLWHRISAVPCNKLLKRIK
ncbi:hypothetical protein TNCV_238191 [Trichonephila clavipes]|nr:hypothetical protein TNCV_238191 [Trichonephila clavipes]